MSDQPSIIDRATCPYEKCLALHINEACTMHDHVENDCGKTDDCSHCTCMKCDEVAL